MSPNDCQFEASDLRCLLVRVLKEKTMKKNLVVIYCGSKKRPKYFPNEYPFVKENNYVIVADFCVSNVLEISWYKSKMSSDFQNKFKLSFPGLKDPAPTIEKFCIRPYSTNERGNDDIS